MVIIAKPYAKKFYNSKEWINCRASYISTVHGLCEHCLARGEHVPGYIVDHIEELTPENINDPEVSLNHGNLQYLCLPCSNTKTFGKDVEVVMEGLEFDVMGNLTKV